MPPLLRVLPSSDAFSELISSFISDPFAKQYYKGLTTINTFRSKKPILGFFSQTPLLTTFKRNLKPILAFFFMYICLFFSGKKFPKKSKKTCYVYVAFWETIFFPWLLVFGAGFFIFVFLNPIIPLVLTSGLWNYCLPRTACFHYSMQACCRLQSAVLDKAANPTMKTIKTAIVKAIEAGWFKP